MFQVIVGWIPLNKFSGSVSSKLYLHIFPFIEIHEFRQAFFKCRGSSKNFHQACYVPVFLSSSYAALSIQLEWVGLQHRVGKLWKCNMRCIRVIFFSFIALAVWDRESTCACLHHKERQFLLTSFSFLVLLKTNDFCAVPQELKDQVTARYPGARQANLKTGGDFPFLSRPDEVNLHLQVYINFCLFYLWFSRLLYTVHSDGISRKPIEH